MKNPAQRRLVIAVQARMNSLRLPGKVLRPVAGKPMLGYLLERLSHLATSIAVVVATSRHATDDAIASYCRDCGVTCIRGPLDDVAARFALVLDECEGDAFVRINGDSPFLDGSLIERAVALFESTGADLATNVQQRTFPKGMSVEVVAASAFRRALPLMVEPEDREHVTRLFYRAPDRWHITAFTSGRSLGGVNLSVDTAADFANFEEIVSRMTRPHWLYGMDDILALSQVSEGVSR